ncbi:MAG: MFS transporter [Chloroflexota bacterium]
MPRGGAWTENDHRDHFYFRTLYFRTPHATLAVLMKELRAVLANRNLQLLLSGRLVSTSGDWLYAIALTVAIYHFSHGSSFLIGVFWIVRLLPSVFLRPFAGAFADRIGYRPAMIVADVGRMVLVAILAVLLNSSTWPIIFPFVFAVTSFSSLFRPANSGLLPRLVNSPEERLAANAATIEMESIALVAGSALGGIFASLWPISTLLLIEAATFGLSAISLWFIRPHPGTPKPPAEPDARPATSRLARARAGAGQSVGLITTHPPLVFSAMVMALPELASGAVLVWIIPYSIHTLHLGNGGVGYFYSALGVGTVAGGAAAAFLGSSVRLDALLAISVAIGGAALALFGLIPLAAPALIAIAVVGVAETVEYAAYETMLQRSVPDYLLGRASGLLDSFLYDMTLFGNLLSGLLAALFGLEYAIGGLGVLTVLVTGAAWMRLRVATRNQPTPRLLATVPAFTQLPEDVREWAVTRMSREEFAPGAVIVTQGEPGDLFYVLGQGKVKVEVATDGQVKTHEMGPGNYFGEIALVRQVPRTATVSAVDQVTVYTLSREDFDELQRRASVLRESLLETVASRLDEDQGFELAVTSRT